VAEVVTSELCHTVSDNRVAKYSTKIYSSVSFSSERERNRGRRYSRGIHESEKRKVSYTYCRGLGRRGNSFDLLDASRPLTIRHSDKGSMKMDTLEIVT
jgi:hypothetical protein